MNCEQKSAWLFLGTFVVWLVVFPILWWRFNAYLSIAAFAIFSLNGLSPLFRRKGARGRVEFDERDFVITRRAALAGGMASYLVFVFGCTGAWGYLYWVERAKTVSIDFLPLMVGLGFVSLMLVKSVTLLAMYRWGRASAGD